MTVCPECSLPARASGPNAPTLAPQSSSPRSCDGVAENAGDPSATPSATGEAATDPAAPDSSSGEAEGARFEGENFGSESLEELPSERVLFPSRTGCLDRLRLLILVPPGARRGNC